MVVEKGASNQIVQRVLLERLTDVKNMEVVYDV